MARSLKKHILYNLYVYANVDGTHTDQGLIVTKQVRGRGYKVVSTHAPDGVTCNLVASSSPAQGEVYTLAKDSDNNTYYVIKLTRHRATLIHKQLVGSAYQFVDNQSVEHVITESENGSVPAVANTTVQLIDYND